MSSYKLYYFNAPGRAETTRLLFTLGGIKFEDARFPREEWPTLKATMPNGQVPVLEVDGQRLAQSRAIERYVAKLAGLYPTDPWQAALVDSTIDTNAEMAELFVSTFSIKDPDAKLAARKEIVAGPLAAKLTRLNDTLGSKSSGYLVGDSVTFADVSLFVLLSLLISGFYDGVPSDLLSAYPNVAAFRSRIASLPNIKAYYESDAVAGAPLVDAFKP